MKYKPSPEEQEMAEQAFKALERRIRENLLHRWRQASLFSGMKDVYDEWICPMTIDILPTAKSRGILTRR